MEHVQGSATVDTVRAVLRGTGDKSVSELPSSNSVSGLTASLISVSRVST